MTTFPQTPAATTALSVATRFYSPAMLNHCIRSYLWGAMYAEAHGIAFDDELYYVSALLHDIGLTDPFDSHRWPLKTRAGTWRGCSGWRPVGRLIVQPGQRRSSCCTCATTSLRPPTPSPTSYRSPPAGTWPGVGRRSSRRSKSGDTLEVSQAQFRARIPGVLRRPGETQAGQRRRRIGRPQCGRTHRGQPARCLRGDKAGSRAGAIKTAADGTERWSN